MNHIRCDVESATAFAAGGMKIRTADFLNGFTFVTTALGLPGLATRMRILFENSVDARVGIRIFDFICPGDVFEST